MTDPTPVDPPAPPGAAGSAVDAQTQAEAALGRALLMVQRLEEDARRRADEETQRVRLQAQQDAAALLAEAQARAAQVADITRQAVARVLAEEHAELLDGLGQLAAIETRLRTLVESSPARVAAALADPVATTSAPPTAPVPPPSDPRGGSEGAAPVTPPPVPVPGTAPGATTAEREIDLDAPVVGPDDAFFADLRAAVDGNARIAGRVEPAPVPVAVPPAARVAPDPVVAPPPAVSPVTVGMGAASLAAAAAAATAASAPEVAPVPVTAPPMPPPPELRVVPDLAPDGAELAPTVAPAAAPADGPPVEPAPVEPAEPGARRSRTARRRTKWARVGTVLRNVGLLLLLFVAFQLWGTAALEHRDQAKLRKEFQVALASQTPAGNGTVPSGDGSTVTTPGTLVPAPPPAPTGEAVAMIRIPKIGVDQAVVEGTGVSDLRKGPGHYRRTPLPGQPGNAAIAGHRTTYGAPFNRLDELAVGDPILVTTLQGTFKYEVSEAPFPVSPSQNDVLFDKGDNRLTLTTCHPKYSASKRLIVVAKLAKNRKPALAPKPSKVAPSAGAVDASTSGDSGAFLPALFWGLLALGAYCGMVWLSRRWVRRAAFLLGAPLVLALLFPFFEQLSRLLPANY